MPSNVRQLLENGTPIYPITERSLVIGLQDAPFEYYVLAWDGASTPVVSKIPAGVVVTYNNTNYTGTLAASATTAPYLYLVASTTQAGEYDRYIVTNNGNNTFSWTPVGSTAPVTPVIVDNLTTNDATKALSAKQGKVLKDELSQFEAEVNTKIDGEYTEETVSLPIVSGTGVSSVIKPLSLSSGKKYHLFIDGDRTNGTSITIYLKDAGGSNRYFRISPSKDTVDYESEITYRVILSSENDLWILPSADIAQIMFYASSGSVLDTTTLSFVFSWDGQIGLEERIDDLEGSVDDIDSQIFETIPLEKKSTQDTLYISSANGNTSNFKNYYTDIYDVRDIDKVTLIVTNSSYLPCRLFGFYSSDTTFDSSTAVLIGPGAGGSMSNVKLSIDVPQSAVSLLVVRQATLLSDTVYVTEKIQSRAKSIKVENGNTVTLSIPSAGKKLVVRIGPSATGIGNEIIDFRYWGYAPLYSGFDVEPETLFNNSSDCFAPFRIKALNNIDGDDINSDNYTGGSHQYNNQSTGSTKTARLGNVTIEVDGVKRTSYEGNFNKFNITWEVFVQANNTRKADGTGREVLKEILGISFIEDEFLCRTELIPLENINLYRTYGYQMVGIYPNGQYSIGDHWYYINGINRDIDNVKSGNKETIAMVSYTDNFKQEMWLDTSVDMGKRIFVVGDIDNGAFEANAKGYFMIVNSDTTLVANNHYFLHGKYIFKLK